MDFYIVKTDREYKKQHKEINKIRTKTWNNLIDNIFGQNTINGFPLFTTYRLIMH